MTSRKTRRGARKATLAADRRRRRVAGADERSATEPMSATHQQSRAVRVSHGGVRVFVYGTLLAGESNHRLLTQARLVGPAATPPLFHLHNLGYFPGLVLGGDQTVNGEVYEVDELTLAALDRLEGHPSFYQRTPIALADGTRVEAYLLTPEKVDGCPVISSGNWRTRGSEGGA